MKEFIDKLALGACEYELPRIGVSTDEIEFDLNTGAVFNGEFRVYSENDLPLKGIVYSTHEAVRIINPTFLGMEMVVKYEVDATYIAKNESIKGSINIVSNGGEVAIPFDVHVDAPSIETSIGKVKNLFHFANLVQVNYEEALNLFKSTRFKKIFLRDDFYLEAVYEGLIGSENIEQAMEEFLIASNKKTPVKFEIAEKRKEYDELTADISDTVVITKSNWGYADIKVTVEGDFIVGYKKSVTSNEFTGSNYEFGYLIEVKRLHQGKNFGRITFSTAIESYSMNILVNAPTEYSIDTIEYQNYIDKIFRMYLDFRNKKVDSVKWADMSLAILDRMRNIKDESFFYRLLQAQILIFKGKESEGSWILENIAEKLIPEKDKNVEMYCFYLYVRTLQKRDKSFTDEVINKIKNYFESGYDNWMLLWMLIYLDDSYDNNPSLKLARIKEQYNKGMNTPLLYYEAACVFNEIPEYLRILNDFEIKVLCYASKMGLYTEKLCNQLAETVMTVRNFNPLLLKVLTTIYADNENINILMAIVTLLIRGNKSEKKYFVWYEEAVKREMKITGLYEYYMSSMPDDFEDEIPQIILMYFSYNDKVSSDRLSILYKQVIEKKSENTYIYDAFSRQMSRLVADSIFEGKNDENLAILYKDVLKSAMVTPEMASTLPKVINTYMISCDNEFVKSVMVIHKETKDISLYPVINGKAYVPLYSENPAIIFEDINGRRYCKSLEYKMVRLLEDEDFLKMCYEISAEDMGLTIYFADKFMKYHSDAEKSIGILKCIVENPSIRDNYRNVIKKEILEYYYENYDGDAVDAYLDEIDELEMDVDSISKVIELMVIRGKYEKAMKFIEKYGYSYIDARRLLRCINKIIVDSEFRKDDQLIDMSMYVFRNGKYNENILKYLSMYYYGSTNDMYAIWKRCDDYEYYDREMCEKLVAQMLFSKMYINKADKVYRVYNSLGATPKIKKAYLFYKAYQYVIKEAVVDDAVFRYILNEIVADNVIPELCKIAYVKYCSTLDNPELESIIVCKDLIYTMCKQNRMLECFKKFERFFKLPHNYIDKVFVEYAASTDSHVYIHYQIETGNLEEKEYVVSEMDNMLGGVYSKSFVLFYGEKINYYITEERNGRTKVTESKCLTREEGLSSNNTRYGMLNDMMICHDMKEEATLKDLAIQYAAISQLNSTIFTVMD